MFTSTMNKIKDLFGSDNKTKEFVCHECGKTMPIGEFGTYCDDEYVCKTCLGEWMNDIYEAEKAEKIRLAVLPQYPEAKEADNKVHTAEEAIAYFNGYVKAIDVKVSDDGKFVTARAEYWEDDVVLSTIYYYVYDLSNGRVIKVVYGGVEYLTFEQVTGQTVEQAIKEQIEMSDIEYAEFLNIKF